MISCFEDEVGVPLELLLELLKPLIQKVLRDHHIIGAIVGIDGTEITTITIHKVIEVLCDTPRIRPPRVLLQRLLNIHQLLQRLQFHTQFQAREGFGKAIHEGLLGL